MSEIPTPETDAFIWSQDYSPTGHQWRNFTRQLERERDEARKHLKEIEEYGTDEINAAIDLRRNLAQALVDLDDMQYQRDEARAHWGTESMNAAQFFGEKTKAIAERDEAREALREAWLAMDEVDGTDRMVNWQNKNASILEGAK